MLPMTPSQRENMIAWLAALCDPPGEASSSSTSSQNTEISQQISLWNHTKPRRSRPCEMGPRLVRGNLLVVPIGNSILYVSPLYLSPQSSQLPELKCVIAPYDDR